MLYVIICKFWRFYVKSVVVLLNFLKLMFYLLLFIYCDGLERIFFSVRDYNLLIGIIVNESFIKKKNK